MSTCVPSLTFYGIETGLVKEEHVMPDYRIAAEELRTRLKLKNLKKCLQDGRLQWFGHLKRMEDSAWSTKPQAFQVSDSFPEDDLRKHGMR